VRNIEIHSDLVDCWDQIDGMAIVIVDKGQLNPATVSRTFKVREKNLSFAGKGVCPVVGTVLRNVSIRKDIRRINVMIGRSK